MSEMIREEEEKDLASLEATLPSGRIRVWAEEGSEAPSSLLGMASRNNPKRGFLFVSKVLGRHIPVKPSEMVASQERLAAQIGEIEGPALAIGLAETATGLGHGVYEALLRRMPNLKAAFAHSTRHPIEGELVGAKFEEPHSHATSHHIHDMAGEAGAIAREAKTLIVIDDEQSTGTTALGLIRSIRQSVAPSATVAIVASLCDWIGPERREEIEREMAAEGVDLRWASLARGHWAFDPNPEFQGKLPDPKPASGRKPWAPARGLGRLGVSGPLEPRPCGKSLRAAALEQIEKAAGRPILVLGAGECAHAPALLALEIERLGAEARFQAISRTPVALGGAIERSIEAPSPMGCDARFYLHNGKPEESHTVVALETREAAEGWEAPFPCEIVWMEETL